MFEFAFGVDDLATTWITYSPLQEAVFSLRTRRHAAKYPWQRRWTESWEAEYRTLDTALLDALVTPRAWAPDFLTPRPTCQRPSVESELATIAGTPPETVAKDFAAAYRGDGAPMPESVAEALADDPAELLARCVAQLRAYWERCLLPQWWPRARTVLEADLAYRGRMFAERGAEGLFAELDHRLSWQAGVLRLDDPDPRVQALGGRYTPVAGRGLVLVPTLFALGAHTVIDADEPPAISYPARGRALMGESSPLRVPDALAELIGPPRARLLLLLDQPASTTALAHRLSVTPGAVSRHLSALATAGLLTRTRAGRSVLYARSALGDALVAGGS
ncbi:helix-turn-helix domain-containing protein [Kitasatospora sp. CB01950]|uniref:helix-turn-helix domain-containing protein n=1 Tax=Kitasatospora sp. CB01950 TaxID=1703930 RepID=UPI00093915B0|nr:helix-turn-helix domain-containing protein [Kitasatospora sp. CB01950]OKJ15909.1 hypothetical protein AMK19_06805 [Kitasatospora sp. CB01950]